MAKGAKNISWPWLFLLRGWCSLTITFTGQFTLGRPKNPLKKDTYKSDEIPDFNHKLTQMMTSASNMERHEFTLVFFSPLLVGIALLYGGISNEKGGSIPCYSTNHIVIVKYFAKNDR